MFEVWFLFLRSIEFDRDFDYFAIAGVTKKIKVFPLNAVTNLDDFRYFVVWNKCLTGLYQMKMLTFSLITLVCAWMSFNYMCLL